MITVGRQIHEDPWVARDVRDYEEWLDKILARRDTEITNIEELELVSGPPHERVRVMIRHKHQYMFWYGGKGEQIGAGGAGQGQGIPKEGAAAGAGRKQKGPGGSTAGTQPGEDEFYPERERLKRNLYKRFRLPLPQRKRGRPRFTTKERKRRAGYSRVGPESRLEFLETAEEYLARQQAARGHGPLPKVFPYEEDDKRYYRLRREMKRITEIIVEIVGDFSGSMTREQLLRLKTFAAWIVDQVRESSNIKTKCLFGTHDVIFKWRREREFFTKASSGGTAFSPAYKGVRDLARKPEYSPERVEHIIFHFTDGDNQSADEAEALRQLAEICKYARLFGYIETVGEKFPHQFSQALLGTTQPPTRPFIKDRPNLFLGRIVRDEDLEKVAKQLVDFLTGEKEVRAHAR